MRVVWALAALALLAGCDDGNRSADGKDKSEFASAANAEAFASTGTGFDYRYAYRLPGSRVKGVLQSNADACDRIGPARCRILSMRYRVDDGNKTRAVLTIRIDPSIARPFGDAVTKNVTGSDGVLVDTEITGADSTATARSTAVVKRLQDQLQNARASTAPEGQARAARLQNALSMIAEVEASQGQTLANAPMLFTYESSSALSGLGSSEANFRTAGQTLENSVAQLVQLLASVGPWCLLMLAVVLVLRWIIHGRAVGSDPEPRHDDGYDSVHNGGDGHAHRERGDNRNLIQRWFSRDEEDQHA
ncbi:hypothetical protein [Sphingomonas kyeonggiensis]|uniref:DUF4349 domain-containing protein n=1 Tax=Sphingomonas kyeonggiensis TaxID=1268553 RepID=A0A7W6JRF3_9SPHN|nr:hypothetical protein [Sphingomonas kyeonggiensis]MBB4098189.1 hypothetical protein [Sphingomonas kyeonggiensis]